MFSWPIWLLLAISVITNSLNGIVKASFSKRIEMTDRINWKFNFWQNIITLFLTVIIYFASGSDFSFSVYSAFFGMVMGITTVTTAFYGLKALSVGPISYTSILISLSAIIPAFAGAIAFGEKITYIQLIGIVFMILCAIFSQNKDSKESNAVSLIWLFFVSITFLSNGICGVVQKIHQSNTLHKTEMPTLIITSFLFSSLFCGIMWLVASKKEAKENTKDKKKFDYSSAVVSGVCLAFPFTLNLFLTGKMDSIIFFPMANILPLVLVILFSVIFLQEKLEIKRWIGIGFGFISAFLLSGIISV